MPSSINSVEIASDRRKASAAELRAAWVSLTRSFSGVSRSRRNDSSCCLSNRPTSAESLSSACSWRHLPPEPGPEYDALSMAAPMAQLAVSSSTSSYIGSSEGLVACKRFLDRPEEEKSTSRIYFVFKDIRLVG